MAPTNLDDLAAFARVAEVRSFTHAASLLGVTPSALSHRMRHLEERLGVRLLARTTRSVTPTAAGERLLLTLKPRIAEIEAALRTLAALRDRPAGDVRLTLDDHSLDHIVWPRLRPLLAACPDITVELITDYALTDIVTARCDGGIRLGGIIDKDMIAVPIGPDERMAVVAARGYFGKNPMPSAPADLVQHNCILFRLKTQGGVYAWEFEKDLRALRVRVRGQAMFTSSPPMLAAALDGFGIAYLPRGMVEPHLKSGRLIEMLGEWLAPFAGYHLYYPSRRQMTPAFALVLDALRYRRSGAARGGGAGD